MIGSRLHVSRKASVVHERRNRQSLEAKTLPIARTVNQKTAWRSVGGRWATADLPPEVLPVPLPCRIGADELR